MGWLSSEREVQSLRDEISAFVGDTLVAVRYFTLDYARWDVAPDLRGPRALTTQTDWQDEGIAYPQGDTLVFGVELDLNSGRTLAVTWQLPGHHESLEILGERLIASTLDHNPDVAVCDVGTTSRWRPLVGKAIAAIYLHYIPWAPHEGFWCTRVHIDFGSTNVVLLLGELTIAGELVPSADNIAVLFDPVTLPEWELRLG